MSNAVDLIDGQKTRLHHPPPIGGARVWHWLAILRPTVVDAQGLRHG